MVCGLTLLDLRRVRLPVCSPATFHPFYNVYFGFGCVDRSSFTTNYHKCYLDENNRSNCIFFLNGMARETLGRRVIVSADCAIAVSDAVLPRSRSEAEPATSSDMK